MRIDSNNPGYVSKLYQTYQAQTGPTEIKSAGKTAAPHDSVQLSDQAKAIHELMQDYKELPEIREEKIAKIKEAITNHTYNVSPQQLAAKMLASED
ncbi:MAG: flagellar biosynthesis anti-sigma factor FlgM [Syntrophomonadaceae bacterium]|nr:flagellar biosynthesis anti-sigma factor FlgM [Syntrophomonadaceae bacterium]